MDQTKFKDSRDCSIDCPGGSLTLCFFIFLLFPTIFDSVDSVDSLTCGKISVACWRVDSLVCRKKALKLEKASLFRYCRTVIGEQSKILNLVTFQYH